MSMLRRTVKPDGHHALRLRFHFSRMKLRFETNRKQSGAHYVRTNLEPEVVFVETSLHRNVNGATGYTIKEGRNREVR